MQSRRRFLHELAGISTTLLIGACAGPRGSVVPTGTLGPNELRATTAPLITSATEISLLQWNNFIPGADPFFKEQAAAFGRQTGPKVTVETINANDLLPRFAAALNARSGPTIFQMQHLQTQILADGLHDLSDLAAEIEQHYGRYYGLLDSSSRVGDRYRAIPWNLGTGAFVYRKSWFQQAGASVPETWEDLRDVIRKMKAFGKPIGQGFGQSFGDPPGWCYPILWSFGAREVDPDGITIAINSPETVAAVTYTVDAWHDGLDQRGLSWDDNNNNAAFLAEEVSATINGTSIYFVAAGLDGRNQPKPWAGDIDHFLTPGGPAGRYQTGLAFTHAIPLYVTDRELEAAVAYLRYIYDPRQYDPWFELQKGFCNGPGERMERHSMWATLPDAIRPLQTAGRLARPFGYAAAPSRQAGEALARYVVVNMFARAIQGQPVRESVQQAERDLKEIYGS